MALIEEIYKPTFEEPTTVDILVSTNGDNTGDNKPSNSTIDVLKITGKLIPLIRINSHVIDGTQIKNLRLNCNELVPTLVFSIYDKQNLSSMFDNIDSDNEVNLQILPKFEDKYKKINLRFFITNITSNNGIINITCSLNITKDENGERNNIWSNIWECWGELTTFDFCNENAKKYGLGFASNINNTDDKRFIYSNGSSNIIDLFKKEVYRGGNPRSILDCWIDWYGYFNLVEITDRLENVDNEEDIKIFETDGIIDADNYSDENEVFEMIPTITNNPNMRLSPLFAQRLKQNTDTGSNIQNGTNRIVSTYNLENNEKIDTQIQNGKVENNIFTKYTYQGESLNDQIDYLVQRDMRKIYFEKMNNNIELELKNPIFGLMRGSQVNIIWFDGDDVNKGLYEDQENKTNIPMDDSSIKDNIDKDGGLILNKKISGRYLIIGMEIIYNRMGNIDTNQLVHKIKLTKVQNER